MPAPQKKSIVVFDFDGVIADSLHAAYSTWNEAGADISLADYVKRFEGNIHDAYKPTDTINFFDAYALKIPHLSLFPGITDTIVNLASTYTLTINSSTLSNLIKQVLDKYNLSPAFDNILGSDIATSKIEKLNMILSNYQTHADQCVMITDTLGDLREATAANIRSIAVTWGFHDLATLQKGQPAKIAHQPDQLPRLVQEILQPA